MEINILKYCKIGLIIILSCACEKNNTEDEFFPTSEFIKTGKYEGDYNPADGWRECSPAARGMNTAILEDLNTEISSLVIDSGYNIHSLLIIKDSYIVAEQYYSRYFDEDTEHKLASCTKSFTSLLMGIAINEGNINGTDEKMLDYFSEYEIDNMSTEKQSITIEHMLTMSAGLDWNELDYLYTDPRNNNYQWKRSDDWIQFVLDRPMEYTPGTVQDYNSGLSELLAVIIAKATGIRTDSFAIEKLFTPLGIEGFYWSLNPEGYTRGGAGLRLTPRDMAKLGQLHINEGEWNSVQLVPPEWIASSGQKQIVAQHLTGFWYGYQFWVTGDRLMYTALGYGGQWIMIVPDYDMVVVFNNHFNEGNANEEGTPMRLFYDYIMQSIWDN